MPIVDAVTAQLKLAMKAKDKGRLAVLRSMRSAFLNEMKKDGSDSLSDEVCQRLLRKLEKQRRESIEAFSKGDREELAAAERAELVVIWEFLPTGGREPDALLGRSGDRRKRGFERQADGQGHGRADEGPQSRDRWQSGPFDRSATARPRDSGERVVRLGRPRPGPYSG